MSSKEYKVLRCRSITELEEQLENYESKGWACAGRTDLFDDMYVLTISIAKELDESEEAATP